MESARRPRCTRRGSRPLSYQIAGFQVEHLFGTALQSAPHLQHLAPWVDARQEAVLPQPMAERLLGHGKTFHPCHLLNHLVADRGIQEQINPP
jgi:hypothetical protein